MSAVTKFLKAGAAALPELGPANTKFAACVFSVAVSVPDVVTGLPETVKILGIAKPTLDTSAQFWNVGSALDPFDVKH
jgi:hypothetical protein